MEEEIHLHSANFGYGRNVIPTGNATGAQCFAFEEPITFTVEQEFDDDKGFTLNLPIGTATAVAYELTTLADRITTRLAEAEEAQATKVFEKRAKQWMRAELMEEPVASHKGADLKAIIKAETSYLKMVVDDMQQSAAYRELAAGMDETDAVQAEASLVAASALLLQQGVAKADVPEQLQKIVTESLDAYRATQKTFDGKGSSPANLYAFAPLVAAPAAFEAASIALAALTSTLAAWFAVKETVDALGPQTETFPGQEQDRMISGPQTESFPLEEQKGSILSTPLDEDFSPKTEGFDTDKSVRPDRTEGMDTGLGVGATNWASDTGKKRTFNIPKAENPV